MSRWRRGHITWHWLEVAVKKGNERTLMHRAPAAGLGLKPVSMAIGATVTNPPLLRENMSCAKWLKSLNSLKWRFTLIHRPPTSPSLPPPLCSYVNGTGLTCTTTSLRPPLFFWAFCLSLYLRSACGVQTVSRRGASAVCANQGVFICEATCSTQLVLLRMSHRQTTYVRGGLRMSSWRRMFEGAAERCRALHSCTDFLSHCFPTGDIRRRGKL